MQLIQELLDRAHNFIPFLVTLLFVALALWTSNYLLLKRAQLSTESRLPRQLMMLGITVIAVVLIILALPISDSTKGDLLSLLGLVLTGMIALSSTSFVSNVMAGLMLRVVKSFKHGDFIRVQEHFGRVTERGLFHTEIQTEARDLLTLPNLYLVSNPVTVVRSSGTIITCDLSLGYDVPYYDVQKVLKEAAIQAGLQEPFVYLKQLGDFSISYRVAGYYPEVKHLLTTQSLLKEKAIDCLHNADIEIVSPTFMNQRQVGESSFVAAPKPEHISKFTQQHPPPETLIFDKADRAEKIQIMTDEKELLTAEIKSLKEDKQLDKKTSGKEISLREERINQLDNIIRIANEKKPE